MYKSRLALVIALFALVAVCVPAAYAKNDNAKSNAGTSKEKNVKLKNFEKVAGKTNAQVHKEQTGAVVKNLKKVAAEEKMIGNVETSKQIEQIASSQEQAQEENAKAIEKIEKKSKVRTFLFGTDYKNLGQLRSNLVHNRNEIRKLTRTMGMVSDEAEKATLQEQLTTLMQERERIKTVISTNENKFSLLGWVARFLTNYKQTPINEEEEEQLEDEIENVIDNSMEGIVENPEDVDAGPEMETVDAGAEPTAGPEMETVDAGAEPTAGAEDVDAGPEMETVSEGTENEGVLEDDIDVVDDVE
ncbi:MAG TPA: hypothetical protein PLF86_01055 [Candidatus Moranbacteria bacterium]|nr:hypothetical protein [Candidatus Moranbacteria bacterium]